MVGMFISSSGMILSCGNIGDEEEALIDLGFELEVRISDTLLAREHRASESIVAKAFRLKI